MSQATVRLVFEGGRLDLAITGYELAAVDSGGLHDWLTGRFELSLAFEGEQTGDAMAVAAELRAWSAELSVGADELAGLRGDLERFVGGAIPELGFRPFEHDVALIFAAGNPATVAMEVRVGSALTTVDPQPVKQSDLLAVLADLDRVLDLFRVRQREQS